MYIELYDFFLKQAVISKFVQWSTCFLVLLRVWQCKNTNTQTCEYMCVDKQPADVSAQNSNGGIQVFFQKIAPIKRNLKR